MTTFQVEDCDELAASHFVGRGDDDIIIQIMMGEGDPGSLQVSVEDVHHCIEYFGG